MVEASVPTLFAQDTPAEPVVQELLHLKSPKEIPPENRKSLEALVQWLGELHQKNILLTCDGYPLLDLGGQSDLLSHAGLLLEIVRIKHSDGMREYHREAGRGEHDPDCATCRHRVTKYRKSGARGGHLKRTIGGVVVFGACTYTNPDGTSTCGCPEYRAANEALVGGGRH